MCKKTKKITEGIVFALALVIFCISTYKLIVIYMEYDVGNKEYKQLEKYKKDEESINSTVGTDSEGTSNNKETIILFDELKKINEDIVGWIEIKDTNINYPITRAENNDYYINHTFEGNVNTSGSIFMNSKNNKDFSDYNSVIYGHNMKNNKMFHDLSNYKDKEFYNEHNIIHVYTPGENYDYEIFSAYVTDANSNAYDSSFENNDYFADYLKDIKSKSFYETNVEVAKDNKIITLSTCTNGKVEERYVVQGRRISK